MLGAKEPLRKLASKGLSREGDQYLAEASGYADDHRNAPESKRVSEQAARVLLRPFQ
jgi:hypothetical protein